MVVRPLAALEEFEAAARLQEEVWGEGYTERVPASLLKVGQRLGGVSAGAFDAHGRLLGFVFGITGLEGGAVEGGRVVHWSDTLAVLPGLRDRGVGTRLKLYQRRALLELGVRRMYWSFDPLQSRNAYLAFARLGAVSREYVRDMYGETGSLLHEGIGTDRLVALWLLDSPRVRARVEGEGPGAGAELPGAGAELPGEGGAPREPGLPPPAELLARAPRLLEVAEEGGFPAPGALHLGVEGDHLLLTIPAEVDGVGEADPALALRWREATREGFLHSFSRGYEARELLREGALSHYLLAPGGEEGP